ncbi:MFS transporter, partial [Acinetobacter baumannii]
RSEAKELLQETYDNIEQKVEDINAQIAELEKKKQILIDQHPKLD